MNIKELTNHLTQINESPSELLQNSAEDIYALEQALYDLAEHLEEIRLGMISYDAGA